MEETIEMLIYELASRVRMFRMSKGTKNKIGELTDREMLLLQVINMKEKVRVTDISLLHPIVSSSTISNTISKLWKDKLVNKTINPENQRETTVSLTPKGKKVVEQIKITNTKVYKTITEALSLTKDEEEVLKRMLVKGIEFFDKELTV